MAVQVSKPSAIEGLMYFGGSIKDNATRCKLKLADLVSVKVRRDRYIDTAKI